MPYLELFKYVGSLLLIIGLIFIVFFFLKKTPLSRFKIISSDKIKLLTQISLGPKRMLVVVQFLDKILLIGITENNMTLLGEVNKDEWFDKGPEMVNGKKKFTSFDSIRSDSSSNPA